MWHTATTLVVCTKSVYTVDSVSVPRECRILPILPATSQRNELINICLFMLSKPSHPIYVKLDGSLVGNDKPKAKTYPDTDRHESWKNQFAYARLWPKKYLILFASCSWPVFVRAVSPGKYKLDRFFKMSPPLLHALRRTPYANIIEISEDA